VPAVRHCSYQHKLPLVPASNEAHWRLSVKPAQLAALLASPSYRPVELIPCRTALPAPEAVVTPVLLGMPALWPTTKLTSDLGAPASFGVQTLTAQLSSSGVFSRGLVSGWRRALERAVGVSLSAEGHTRASLAAASFRGTQTNSRRFLPMPTLVESRPASQLGLLAAPKAGVGAATASVLPSVLLQQTLPACVKSRVSR